MRTPNRHCKKCGQPFYARPSNKAHRYCSRDCRFADMRATITPPNTSDGFCECGCGERPPLATQTHTGLGYVIGQPIRFCRGHNNAGREIKKQRWVEKDCGYDTPCWVWQLGCNLDGYGRVKFRGKQRPAHRVVYEREVGTIAQGLELDHLCHNKRCVNPSHLNVVTRSEHTRRHLAIRWGHGAT